MDDECHDEDGYLTDRYRARLRQFPYLAADSWLSHNTPAPQPAMWVRDKCMMKRQRYKYWPSEAGAMRKWMMIGGFAGRGEE